MISRTRRASPGPHRPKFLGLFATAFAVAAAGGSIFLTAGHGPTLLLNRTPSEPLGLYLRTSETVRPGVMVAFRTPDPAFPYADRHMAYLHRRPLLKRVAAGPGDRVCTRGDTLVINGLTRAPIQRWDREGRALPRWSGCRPLRADEVFVFSARVPNSFDSRYYGPVNRGAILGVYRFAGAL